MYSRQRPRLLGLSRFATARDFHKINTVYIKALVWSLKQKMSVLSAAGGHATRAPLGASKGDFNSELKGKFLMVDIKDDDGSGNGEKRLAEIIEVESLDLPNNQIRVWVTDLLTPEIITLPSNWEELGKRIEEGKRAMQLMPSSGEKEDSHKSSAVKRRGRRGSGQRRFSAGGFRF